MHLQRSFCLFLKFGFGTAVLCCVLAASHGFDPDPLALDRLTAEEESLEFGAGYTSVKRCITGNISCGGTDIAGTPCPPGAANKSQCVANALDEDCITVSGCCADHCTDSYLAVCSNSPVVYKCKAAGGGWNWVNSGAGAENCGDVGTCY